LERNGTKNVRPLQLAAFDRETVLPIYTIPDEENAGGASLARAVGPQEADVVAKPLSQMLTAGEIARTRLVKIDVEGAEVAAVAGLIPALEDMRADLELVVEALPETVDAVCSALGAAGFRASPLANPPDPLEAAEQVTYLVFSRRDAETRNDQR
jgi:FkbM family methyltransferase